MQFVVLFRSPQALPLVVEAPGGSRVIDLCDESGAPVPFSCRGASCGTCRIEIVEGAELLEAPMDEELEVLDAFGDDPKTHRLACQARFRDRGTGQVTVRPAP